MGWYQRRVHGGLSDLDFRTWTFGLGLSDLDFRTWTFGLGLSDLDRRKANRTDGRTNGWTDGRTDSPCVLQDFVPFGAAALLPLNLNHIPLKQGTGTADHLPP